MIESRKSMDLSRDFGLAANIIEKDYVLGWLLAGISAHSELGANWAFKGGTYRKKCYFATYRFSEDLDFSLTNSTHLDQAYFENTLRRRGASARPSAGPRKIRAKNAGHSIDGIVPFNANDTKWPRRQHWRK